MSGKKVSFGAKQTAKPTSLDEWVDSPNELEPIEKNDATKVPMKRLTFDVPADLHKRIKIQCAMQGKQMADEIRKLLDQHFNNDVNI